jgi:hypothetical protein
MRYLVFYEEELCSWLIDRVIFGKILVKNFAYLEIYFWQNSSGLLEIVSYY